MEEMNGQPSDTQTAAASKDKEDVIGLLKQLLQEAEAGRLVGFGAVTILAPGNYSIAGTKNYLLEMLCGTEDLHDFYKAVKAQMIAAQMQRQHPLRSIVKPPPGWKP